MRLIATADLHGHLPAVPDCDVLVVAGDVTPRNSHDTAYQAQWLDTTFRAWLEAVPARHVVGVAGNHDFVFERAGAVPALSWHYLEDSGVTLDGVRFWGSPWTPWFFGWAFNAPRDDPGEAFLAARMTGCPDDVDVLVLHGPPRGYGDRTATGIDAGSVATVALIDRVAPRLCVFGHIHEGRGAWRRGATALANVTYVDLAYAPLDLPLPAFSLDGLG